MVGGGRKKMTAARIVAGISSIGLSTEELVCATQNSMDN